MIYAAFDPVTLALVGLGISGAGAAASGIAGLASKPKTPAPPTLPATPPPIQQPQGQPTGFGGGPSPSFLAAAATPQPQNVSGTKSLLGQ